MNTGFLDPRYADTHKNVGPIEFDLSGEKELVEWTRACIKHGNARRTNMLQRFTVFSTPFGVDVVIGKSEMSFPDVTIEQMELGEDAYAAGAYIQDAFPFLTPEQREFLMTGITPGQWDLIFAEEEE